jgi:signal peptidase I
MTKKNTPALKTPSEAPPVPEPVDLSMKETPLEGLANICSIVVVGLFIFTFLGQNFVIPSGSMEKTLLVGDHVLVDRITFAPPTKWMPLVHYREPKRGDVVVFKKPVMDDPNKDGNPQNLTLVKRLIGLPGDHIRLHDGIVSINGVPQNQPHATTPDNHVEFLDEFPSVPPDPEPGNFIPETWAVDFPNHIENGELVVPSGHYFMMGDNRHRSADSRFWGFVPRENILGRPLFNYWSFQTPDDQLEKPGIGNSLSWMGHVALHFFTETRWSRTLHRIR